MKEEVILVDEQDKEIGRMEKMEAHEKAILHRAFSVFIFNSKGELLLQQRAADKYHSAGLWTNTCCSHPRPGEKTIDAAKRRLVEEMGLNLELEFKTSFVYKAPFDNNLTEHEFDYVYTGLTDKDPVINPAEVSSYKWLSLPVIKEDIKRNPETFTAWFKIALKEIF